MIRVYDQHGKPLKDAILEVKLSTPDKENEIHLPTFVMDQVNKSFVPHVLSIPHNSKVNFPNSDDIRHHVYSFSKAKPFELKLYAGKPKAPIEFQQAGVVVLGCNIHDAMIGYIYVHDSDKTYQSNEQGELFIDVPHTSVKSLWLWHPRNKQGVNIKQAVDSDIFISNSEPINLTIDLLSPQPTDSFEDVFSNHH